MSSVQWCPVHSEQNEGWWAQTEMQKVCSDCEETAFHCEHDQVLTNGYPGNLGAIPKPCGRGTGQPALDGPA